MKHILLTTEEVVAAAESTDDLLTQFNNAIAGMDLGEIWTKYGERVLVAASVVVFGYFIAKWVANVILKYVKKLDIATGATKIVEGIVKFVLYFIVILTAASILGIPVTSVLAIFSAFALAFSLAIKDILALFASGITIILSKPFVSGDFVEIPEEGVSGFVSEVGLIHTHLFTADNKEIIIPNSIVAADTIINYSKIGFRRLDAVYSIGHNENFEKAKQIIKEVVDSEPLVEKDRDIFIMVTAIGPSSVDIVCKVYVKWDDYETLRCRLNEKIKLAFDENGITFPYNQIDVHMK